MIRKLFAIIAALYLIGFCAHAFYLHKTVYGDGIFYFSWLRSGVVDHNWNFTNEYAYFHATQPMSPLRIPGNKYALGPALLWSPAYIWTHLLIHGTGYEFPYQIITGLMSVLYALSGILLLYLLLEKRFGKVASAAAIIGIAGATNLLFYGSLDAVNSHAISFFASTLLLTFLFQKQKHWFAIGCVVGLIALIRTQDAILGLMIVPFIEWKKIWRVILGFLCVFSLQLTAWQAVYGTFWKSPYISGTEGFDFLHPHIIGVLFSPQNGFILWTPIVLLGWIGLLYKRTDKKLLWMAGIVLLQLYLIASWSTWWEGASYSGRMFVSILPFIGFGLGNLFSVVITRRFRYQILFYGIVLPLSVINALMIVYFLLTK